MTDPAEALRRLRRQLIDAPENKFVEVVRVLEQAGDRPEVREAIGSIRPRLAQVRPGRRMTLKRVFCDPFEDLLEPPAGGDGPAGAIPRRFIDTVWRETAKRADPRHMEPLERAVAGLDSADADARHALGCRLWYASAEALRRLIAEAPRELGAETLAAAAEILAFVEIGHHIAALKNALPPKPIPTLDADACRLIEAAVQETARLSPGKPYYLLLTVMLRMRRPADLPAALQDMDFGKAKREKPAVFARLAGLAVDALESAGDGGAPQTPDPAAAAAVAERLAESLDAATRLLTAVGDAQYDDRLKKVRAAVREMVRRDVLAPARVLAVAPLPPPPAGAPLPAPDDERQTAAEDCVRAVRRCERFAGSPAAAAEVAATLADIAARVEEDVAAWRKALAARPERNPADADADAEMLSISYAVRLLELTAGSNRAAALFRDVVVLSDTA